MNLCAIPASRPSRMKVTLKSSTVKSNGFRSSALKKAPARKSSYWLSVLAKPSLVTTMTPPLKPNSPPRANPTSTISTDRWNSRLPASRR